MARRQITKYAGQHVHDTRSEKKRIMEASKAKGRNEMTEPMIRGIRKTVDLTPTPEGMQMIMRMLTEQIAASHAVIEQNQQRIQLSQETIDDLCNIEYMGSKPRIALTNAQAFLLIDALNTFIAHLEENCITEEERIKNIEKGLSGTPQHEEEDTP